METSRTRAVGMLFDGLRRAIVMRWGRDGILRKSDWCGRLHIKPHRVEQGELPTLTIAAICEIRGEFSFLTATHYLMEFDFKLLVNGIRCARLREFQPPRNLFRDAVNSCVFDVEKHLVSRYFQRAKHTVFKASIAIHRPRHRAVKQ